MIPPTGDVSTLSSNLSVRDERFHAWKWLILAFIPALCFFIWAMDGRRLLPTSPYILTRDGGLVPVPSVTLLLTACGLLAVLVSRAAYFLFTPPADARILSSAVSTSLIFLFAAGVRVAAVMTALPSARGIAWLSVLADMLVLAILFWMLRRSGKSPWWAALYAFHPLPLVLISSSAHFWVLLLLPLSLIVARLPHRVGPFARLLVSITLVLLTAWLVTHPANESFAAELLGIARIPGKFLPFVILQILLQGMLLILSARGSWSFFRFLNHAVVLFLIAAPVFHPAFVMLLLVLMPLSWNLAGWLLSLLMLPLCVIAPPFLLLELLWIPVILIECQDLLRRRPMTLAPRLPDRYDTPLSRPSFPEPHASLVSSQS